MTINCNKPNLPIIKDDAITLKTNDGCSTTYKTGTHSCSNEYIILPQIIAQGITKYSTTSDPNISETELGNFKQEVYEKFLSLPDYDFTQIHGSDGRVIKDAMLKNFERLFDCYASDKTITPEEYTKMLKIMLDSAKNQFLNVIQDKEQIDSVDAKNQQENKNVFSKLLNLLK